MGSLKRDLATGGTFFAALLGLISHGAAQSTSPTPTAHYTTLYSFGSHPHDGAGPRGIAVGSGGVLYGTTYAGGLNVGTVFALAPPASPGGAWTEAVLFRFNGADGGLPEGTVTIGGGGVLYGTTQTGGEPQGQGTVYSLSPPASPGDPWTERVLYTLTAAREDTDGRYPVGTLAIDSDGVLYGVTSAGGGSCQLSDGCGLVFSLTPPTSSGGSWTENVLLRFGALAGEEYPVSASVVIGDGGVLYGNVGQTIYSLTPPASPGAPWTEAALYAFSGGTDREIPGAVAIGSGGVLYGTTARRALDGGTVFSLSPPASQGAPWVRTLLHSFGSSDGAAPIGGVAIGPRTGTLYSTAGGTFHAGVLFALEPPPSPGASWTYRHLHSFGSGTDGTFPLGTVVLGSDGLLYGSTNGGGTNGSGTVFSVVP